MNLIKLSRCILGEYHKQNCAGGLHWNNENKICDWPNDAKCSSGNLKFYLGFAFFETEKGKH